MEDYIIYIVLGVIAFFSIVFFIVYTILLSKTKKNSLFFKKIVYINNLYHFNNKLPKILNFSPILKSKRGLENLDFNRFMANEIKNNRSYYQNLFYNLDKNSSDYIKYLDEYKSIEVYTTKEEFLQLKIKGMTYKTFNKCEKILYKIKKKNKPITFITAKCHATYTSPAGRNSYWRDMAFSYFELKNFLSDLDCGNNKIYLERRYNEISKREQRVINRERELKEKVKKYKDIDKKEQQVIAREQELKGKEQEFAEATKGHIYSTEKKEEIAGATVDQGELSSYQKLKLLKKQFENGEITREEYTKLRNELL